MKSDSFVTLVLVKCLVFVLLMTIHTARADVIEGKKCPSGAPGKCISIYKCLPAIQDLREKRRHDFERCGFDNYIEIICCLEEKGEAILRKPTRRKSLEACQKFSDMAPPRIYYQVLLKEPAYLGEFPHMVAVGYMDDEDVLNWSCGASLISNNYAISAAHCFIRRNGRRPVKVRMGVVNITGEESVSPKDYDIVNITMHPEYNRKTKQNDVALLKLGGPVKFSQYVLPACLYQEHDNPRGLVITGWGTIETSGDASETLQKAPLEPVSVEDCNFNYAFLPLGRPITSLQICAKSHDGRKDACQGDSGGPLQIQMMTSNLYTIVGVISYGRSCGGSTPSVYARVYSYLDWIENIVWP